MIVARATNQHGQAIGCLCNAGAKVFGSIQQQWTDLCNVGEYFLFFNHLPFVVAIVVNPDFCSWKNIIGIWQVNHVRRLCYSHGLQSKTQSCSIGHNSIACKLKHNIHCVKIQHTHHLVNTVDFNVKKLYDQCVANGQSMLLTKDNSAGIV